MKKVLILNLIIILITLIITIGLLLNPIIPPIFSPRVESVSIAPRADPNNDERFVPSYINLPVESTISWTNHDSIEHIVTSDEEELFDSGPISPGDSFENEFVSSGEFGYHCTIHPFMRGMVIVE